MKSILKPHHFLLLFLIVAWLTPPTLRAAEGGGGAAGPAQEYIVVSGGVTLHHWEKWKAEPHDNWWLNFIRASRIRIQQLREQGVPGSQITWFVYSPAYKTRAKQEGKELFSTIESVRDAYGIKLKYFSRTSELINYLNNGQPRDRVKIANFEYFGHSNKAAFLFDYSNIIDSASKVWLHEDDLNQIRRDIFTRDAFAKSWGCHSGESMSQKFRAVTGIRMWGAVGRSQYNTHELPSLASSTGRWKY